MNRELPWAGLWGLALAVVGAIVSLVFGCFVDVSPPVLEGPAQKRPSSSLPLLPAYLPPRPEDAPESIRDSVLLGARIVAETRRMLPDFVGNDLSCNTCHFNGGITRGGRNGGISLVGVAAKYPLYRARQGTAVDLARRIDDCFERSMNGRPLPEDSRERTALLTYYQWISKGLPIYADVPWLGTRSLKRKHTPDAGSGKSVYSRQCAFCHGLDGQGTPIAPALWGPRSFNRGAGMSELRHFASFTYYNMPRQNPELTEEQALDVAAFVTQQPRPMFKPGTTK